MDPSDQEYAIVVKMAETLVPDVCALIMAALADIHINLGYQKWRERTNDLNREYREMVQLIERSNGSICLHFANCVNSFTFNYRDMNFGGGGITHHSYRAAIWHVAKNIFRDTFIDLPENYFHAKLYTELKI